MFLNSEYWSFQLPHKNISHVSLAFIMNHKKMDQTSNEKLSKLVILQIRHHHSIQFCTLAFQISNDNSQNGIFIRLAFHNNYNTKEVLLENLILLFNTPFLNINLFCDIGQLKLSTIK